MIIKTIEDVLKQPEADLIVNNIVDRWHKGLYSLPFICGLPGTGKSSTCFRLAELTTLKFTNKVVVKTKVIENLSDLARFAMDSKEDEVNQAVVEEVSTLFPSRRAMAGSNVDLAKILDTCRKKKIILYANAPIWTSMDGHMRSMGTIYIETLKIYKQVGIVLSKFFRLQTNPATGKTYTHTMLRNGRDVKRMYTRMPNMEAWKEYELKKDKFMQNLYERILKRETKKLDKENAELGIQGRPQTARPLTPNELQVYDLKINQKMTYKQIGEILNVSAPTAFEILQKANKKLNMVKEINPISPNNGNPTSNKVNLEYPDNNLVADDEVTD
jgi:DNA-binding CsgD family transcriptional regulator